MQAIALPTRIQLPWAANAGGSFIRPIPLNSQIGVQNGAASFFDGYPPLTMQPIASGGTPPFGQDTNGILKLITQWNQWQAVGAFVPWDSTFSAAIGGYPLGAVVASTTTAGLLWVSTSDDNTTNPDTGGAGWNPFSLFGGSNPGDVRLTLRTTAALGWVLINADPFTIGNATSGATYANANAAAVYAVIWQGVSNSFAPVSGGRGANPAGDFAASKTIAFPRSLGRALAVAGAGTGLTSRSLGQFLGEENHLQTLAELAAHIHAITDTGHTHNYQGSSGSAFQAVSTSGSNVPNTTTLATTNNTTGISINSSGLSTPFNVMQPTTFFNLELKL